MKVIVVLPAYNCAMTLKKTVSNIPLNLVNEIVLVDDCSTDETLQIAKACNLSHVYRHDKNLGYGANQKSCYDRAMFLKADIIIMLHPDYQYDPKLIPDILNKISKGAKIVFASRMMFKIEALKNGMPFYKYISNRGLTIFQNLVLGKKLSEYHTGYRAYTKEVLSNIDYHSLSNDFIFDNQIILKSFEKGYEISELYCPAKYDKFSSSINFKRSLKYGFLVVYYTFKHIIKK